MKEIFFDVVFCCFFDIFFFSLDLKGFFHQKGCGDGLKSNLKSLTKRRVKQRKTLAEIRLPHMIAS